jgi:ubiquinone/menaquinone biosynthesis C-methylase UbiE
MARLGRTDLHPRGRTATARVVDALDLSPGDRVLELGCGTGGSMVTIGLTEQVKIDGVDILPEMLAVAKKRLLLAGLRSRSVLMRADASNLPVASGTYHSAYAESVVGFQSPDVAQRILAEVFRALRPSGSFVAVDAVWKHGVSADVADTIYRSCISDFGLSQASQQPWNVDDWTALMQEVGFTVADARRLYRVKPLAAITPDGAGRCAEQCRGRSLRGTGSRGV